MINGKIFPLSTVELDVKKKYLEENLAKGYISECDGPYASAKPEFPHSNS